MIADPGACDLDELERVLGVSFRDRRLLLRATTHSSFDGEPQVGNNERLEFLGDAVLKLCVAEYVFESYPDEDEGKLSSLVAFAVSEATLSGIASRLGLSNFLRLGKSLEITGGRYQASILADLFEAIVGAMYLDRGLGVTSHFILREISPSLPSPGHISAWKTHKTRLQELIQKEVKKSPTYRCISQEGPDHAKIFHVMVVLDGDILGEGKGKCKKEAEEDAASHALDRILRREALLSRHRHPRNSDLPSLPSKEFRENLHSEG